MLTWNTPTFLNHILFSRAYVGLLPVPLAERVCIPDPEGGSGCLVSGEGGGQCSTCQLGCLDTNVHARPF